jgi:hypothetical protein
MWDHEGPRFIAICGCSPHISKSAISFSAFGRFSDFSCFWQAQKLKSWKANYVTKLIIMLQSIDPTLKTITSKNGCRSICFFCFFFAFSAFELFLFVQNLCKRPAFFRSGPEMRPQLFSRFLEHFRAFWAWTSSKKLNAKVLMATPGMTWLSINVYYAYDSI